MVKKQKLFSSALPLLKFPLHIRSQGPSAQYGFTLMELLVVMFMMAAIGLAVIASYANHRPLRNLRIAQNEMVTNLRKAQSYTLSSRLLPNGQPAQYYLLRLESGNISQYRMQGMYDITNPPAKVLNIETIQLPPGVRIQNQMTVVVNGTTYYTNCLLISFQLPFAKMLANRSCAGGPPTVFAGDDYDKITKFISNNADTVTSDFVATVTLTDVNGGNPRVVIINGITGVISFQ